jgi:peptidoglycan hydrolase-like protein with peptidoglycan-binding domain
MVQPKYSPEEALQRIKLMMEYDLSKTSTENKKVVLEQTTDLTIDDIKNGKSIVKLGMKDPIVGKIQELLISAGYKNISKSGEPDNDFGSLTKGQVQKFQSENTNDKGEPLQKDGKVGPETIKALLKKSESKEGNSIFNCVKNYYADYESKLSADLRNKIKYEYFQDYMSITRPILNNDGVEGKYKENFFTDGKYELIRDGRSYENKTKKYTPFNDSQESKWFCMGERKYGVDDTKPSPEDKTTTPTQPVSQQTQTASQQTQATPDSLLCIKNHCTSKQIPFDSDAGVKINGNNFIRVAWDKNKSWYFAEGGMWFEYTSQFPKPNEGKIGKWSCDGYSNFIIQKDNGSIYKSLNPSEEQTQPAAQQTQSVDNATQNTELAAGYSDPNQQSTLRRRDSPLDDILKNQDINKSACRKNISDYFNAWRTRSVVPDDIQQASKNIVQQCANQNYGKFGIGGGKFDEMLDVLMGNHPSGIKQYGEDKQWRIQKPITIQNTRRK